MYEVTFSKKATKDLEKLPSIISQRIVSKLERARIRPERFFQRLVGKETYKLRVGNYRVIADIENKNLHILVIELGHRKNIYASKN